MINVMEELPDRRPFGSIGGFGKAEPVFELVSRVAFAVTSITLMVLAGLLIGYAGTQVWATYRSAGDAVGSTLLEAIGYTVIAIAVFDVGKYLFEEEAVRAREMRQPGEARRSMTKFISTIAIAVFLESLVSMFEASKQDMRMMIYPTLALFSGVALVVGLGIYQRLSVVVEKHAGLNREEDDERARGQE